MSKHLTNLKAYKIKINVVLGNAIVNGEFAYPVVADASSHVLIFWLQGNEFGDKNLTFVRSVQSIGNSGWPLMISTF